MANSDEETERKRKHRSKKKHKRKKSEDQSKQKVDDPSASSGDGSERRAHRKKMKKQRKKKRHRKHSASPDRSVSKDDAARLPPKVSGSSAVTPDETTAERGMDASVRPKGPMTKEEWDKQQSIVRKVYDPETQRTRLVRGDGEIVEEIVSRDRHLSINKAATRGDGAHYQSVLGLTKK